MRILLVGSGAREHAIARALLRSPQKTELFCFATNNNPGIQPLTKKYHVVDMCDLSSLTKTARDWQVSFAIIGPEAPLEKGLADSLWQAGIPVIGPKKKLAQIESSKAFARDLMNKYEIPGSLRYRVFNGLAGVREYLEELGEGNYVVKANGLMSGKGVKVAGDHLRSIQEAIHFCEKLHAAHSAFLIEEKLLGEEFSLLSFCDGEHIVHMPAVQDHKRAFVGDLGPNTGGMGSYSDANHRLPFLADKDMKAAQKINEATMRALNEECQDKYVGILYGSFIATKTGVQLIEFNARFGDPEALNLLAILKSDFVKICEAMAHGNLSKDLVEFEKAATVCKYVVPKGYPDKPQKDVLIDISHVENSEQLYLAAVNLSDEKLFATGSRAAAVVGVADTIFDAEKIVEEEIKRIQGDLFHREDIGTRELINRRIANMRSVRQRESQVS